MNHYSRYIKSAFKKLRSKDSNEVSTKLIPKEKQALIITIIVASIPAVVTLITVAIS